MCPMSPRIAIRLRRELAEFSGRKITDGGDGTLAVLRVMQVDQDRPGARMTHAGYQFPQARSGQDDQQVAGVAQAVEMDLR